MPTWLLLVAWVLLFGSLAVVRHRLASRNPETLVLRGDGQVELAGQEGVTTAVIGQGTVVLPWLVVLELRIQGRARFIPIAADALDPDAHRQLRLWLRWRADSDASN